jgi:hypothetical protein
VHPTTEHPRGLGRSVAAVALCVQLVVVHAGGAEPVVYVSACATDEDVCSKPTHRSWSLLQRLALSVSSQVVGRVDAT